MIDAETADVERRLRVIQLDVKRLKVQARAFHDSGEDPALRPELERHIRSLHAQLQALADEVQINSLAV